MRLLGAIEQGFCMMSAKFPVNHAQNENHIHLCSTQDPNEKWQATKLWMTNCLWLQVLQHTDKVPETLGGGRWVSCYLSRYGICSRLHRQYRSFKTMIATPHLQEVGIIGAGLSKGALVSIECAFCRECVNFAVAWWWRWRWWSMMVDGD